MDDFAKFRNICDNVYQRLRDLIIKDDNTVMFIDRMLRDKVAIKIRHFEN